MTPPRDLTASIRGRLLNHAKTSGEDYNRILVRYAIERLLFRLSMTEARESYILKGAMLFVTWPEHVFRPTGDVDFLGHGSPEPTDVAELFARICKVAVPADGITFDHDKIEVEPVRREEMYRGVRLKLTARLGTAVVHLHVDVGFGDHVHPAPSRGTFPGLLDDLPPAEVLMYPPETVIAEKFEAAVRFGEANSRMKDFYDIWVTTRTFAFDLATLVEAVGGTLRRRGTEMPEGLPIALTPDFAAIRDKQSQWQGFLRRNPPTLAPPPLEGLLNELRRFFEPVIAGVASPETATGTWNRDRGAWE